MLKGLEDRIAYLKNWEVTPSQETSQLEAFFYGRIKRKKSLLSLCQRIIVHLFCLLANFSL